MVNLEEVLVHTTDSSKSPMFFFAKRGYIFFEPIGYFLKWTFTEDGCFFNLQAFFVHPQKTAGNFGSDGLRGGVGVPCHLSVLGEFGSERQRDTTHQSEFFIPESWFKNPPKLEVFGLKCFFDSAGFQRNSPTKNQQWLEIPGWFLGQWWRGISDHILKSIATRQILVT